MREIALFVEDFAHQQVIGALIQRMTEKYGIAVQLHWRSTTHGYGRVVREFKEFLRDLDRQGNGLPDLIVVATDSNCKGLNERVKEIGNQDVSVQTILAIPDPHVERWLLLDGLAFKSVFGKGCDAPDQKCDRGRYKRCLIEAIHATRTRPTLGGIEYAEDIVQEMDINRATQVDKSFRHFVEQLRSTFQGWQS